MLNISYIQTNYLNRDVFKLVYNMHGGFFGLK